MANQNAKILTAEQEAKLRQPIDEHVGKIQEKLDALRVDGTDKVVELLNDIDSLKKDHIYTQQEKDTRMTQLKADLEKAKAVEAKNKDEVSKLVAEGEAYIKAHYDQEYFQPVAASCVEEKAEAQKKYQERVAELEKEHQDTISKLKDRTRSRTRSMFIRTGFSTPRCSWRRIFRRQRIASMRHSDINIT